VEAAMQDVRERLQAYLTRLSDRLILDNRDGKVQPRVFHDTIVDTGFELCDLIKDLNIIQDSALEAARKGLELALIGVTPQELRKNLDVRSDVKKDVDTILSKFF
jgi:hypothetical protein